MLPGTRSQALCPISYVCIIATRRIKTVFYDGGMCVFMAIVLTDRDTPSYVYDMIKILHNVQARYK